jgi:hypothetical protein
MGFTVLTSPPNPLSGTLWVGAREGELRCYGGIYVSAWGNYDATLGNVGALGKGLEWKGRYVLAALRVLLHLY